MINYSNRPYGLPWVLVPRLKYIDFKFSEVPRMTKQRTSFYFEFDSNFDEDVIISDRRFHLSFSGWYMDCGILLPKELYASLRLTAHPSSSKFRDGYCYECTFKIEKRGFEYKKYQVSELYEQMVLILQEFIDSGKASYDDGLFKGNIYINLDWVDAMNNVFH